VSGPVSTGIVEAEEAPERGDLLGGGADKAGLNRGEDGIDDPGLLVGLLAGPFLTGACKLDPDGDRLLAGPSAIGGLLAGACKLDPLGDALLAGPFLAGECPGGSLQVEDPGDPKGIIGE